MAAVQPASILVVDDQPHNLVALEATLAGIDCTLVTASSGRDALRCLLAQDFAVILLDVRMPIMDGFETASLIRARPRSQSTPIIFLTAWDPGGAQVEQSYQLGGIDYIFKPFDAFILRSKVTFFVDLYRKTAELTRVASELDQSQERFRALIEHAPDLTLIIEDTGVIRYASPSVERTLGFSARQIDGHVLASFLHPDDVASQQSDIARLLKTGLPNSPTSRRWRHLDGSYRVLESTATNLMSTPSVAGLVVHARDVTERNRAEDQVRALNAELERSQAEAELRHQALHDGLTGLPNRVLLNGRLEQAISSSDAHCALVLLDLDRFKEVNDALGHHVGDMLLQQIGQRLQSELPGELVARLGGDEFAVLLPGTDAVRAASVARDLMHVFQTPFMLASQSIEVDASIGIAVAPEHGHDADTLLRRADVAMYQAKGSGIGVALYSHAEDEQRPDRLALLGELRHAVERGELLLHYQPKLDLRDGTLVGLEALVRWQHPRRGLLAPQEFIHLAEQSGLIHTVSLWVLEAALRQQQAWRGIGLVVPVAVNLSRRTLHDPLLPDKVAQLLTLWDVPASAVVLEITESSLIADPVRARENLNQLRALGVHMSIDDFGTGYSSLASLQDLSVDELKIDQSFVQAMATHPGARAIVRAIIDLADALELRVVAEGVEDRAAWDVLAGLGCDVAQGYFLSRPLAASELEAWIAEVSPTWMAIARSADAHDTLQERIRGRDARLAAEEEFIARKQAEADLRASEERNRLALQAAGMGTWDWDVVHDVVRWSVETQALPGLAHATFEGSMTAFRQLIHPDDLAAAEAELQAALAEHRDCTFAYRLVRPEAGSSVHWIEARGRGLYASDGSVMRVTGTNMDITERKLAQEALVASEDRFRRQYKGVPLPTYSWLQVGDDFHMQDFNDAAEAIAEGDVREWIGVRASERYADYPTILADLRACVVEQSTIRREVHFRYPITGRERDLILSYVFVPPQTVMLHNVDITERKLAEKQREALAQSEKLRALGQMASGIAHDLNQSLMLMASYSDLARQALTRDPLDLAELDDLMTTATQAALDGGETVKRLLLFTRESPEQETLRVDLGSIARDAAQLTAPRWRDAPQVQGWHISLHVEAEEGTIIQGSPARLREVMTNLIFNAVDALPAGGTIRLRVLAEAERGIIEIADSGAGISAEVQKRMFEPFFTTKGEAGTGLGLAMVFGIVQHHGGQIEVHSEPGHGTTLRMSFPLASPAVEASTLAAAAVEAEPLRPLRVLAVDDEPMMTRAVVRILKPGGHLVSVAGSGEEALEKLLDQAFDVVVSDMGLGAGMNGLELAEAVRRGWPQVRFLLATGWGAAMDPVEVRSKGVEAVLAKPYHPSDLVRALGGPTLAEPAAR